MLVTHMITHTFKVQETMTQISSAQHKHIKALNSLQNYIWGLKSQLGDSEGLGGKVW